MNKLLASAVLLLLFSGCRGDGAESSESGSHKFELSPGELRDFSRKASAGDVLSARKLGDHYLFARSDVERGLRWYRIAASRGDVQSMHSLFLILRSGGDSGSCEEARKWLVMATTTSDDPDFVSDNFLRREIESIVRGGSVCSEQ
jgi:TPR repeat protein